MIFDDPLIIEAIKKDARARYPEEACGVIVANQYVPCPNIAANPKETFKIDPALFPLDGSWQAVVHSHPDPNKGLEPSIEDMQAQLSTGLPWGLVAVWADAISDVMFWGDDIPTPDLIGRPFRSGPTGTDGKGDCYAIIRDFYKLEKNIRLREFPRDDAWWATHDKSKQGDMYRENFKSAGFIEISESELQYGDILLIAIRSEKPNHAGIYLGNGLMLHHLQHRLSRREPANPYKKMITHYLRYDVNKALSDE